MRSKPNGEVLMRKLVAMSVLAALVLGVNASAFAQDPPDPWSGWLIGPKDRGIGRQFSGKLKQIDEVNRGQKLKIYLLLLNKADLAGTFHPDLAYIIKLVFMACYT